LFVDVAGLAEVLPLGFRNRIELVFLIGPYELSERRQVLELGVNAKTFRLNSTPIVNLFGQTAEPVLLEQRKYEYPVIPDVRRPQATEVFSIDEVVTVNPQTNAVVGFEPFYSFRHATLRDRQQTFWLAHRRNSAKQGDEGSEVSISMVDLSARPSPSVSSSTTTRQIGSPSLRPSRSRM
jgi:type VI secretion system protein ImpG